MNTQTPAQKAQGNSLTVLQKDIMGDRMTAQLKMALPDHISIEKFQRTVITAVNKDQSLVAADRLSLFTSCVECAQDGLLPNGKEAALVIFNTKNRTTNTWEKRVQYMPMIQGIYKRARNSGEIVMLNAHVVHENDHFDYQLGFEPRLDHKPALGGRGDIVGVYAIAQLKDGTREPEFMTKDEVEEVRATSKAKDNGPWVSWWGEMARKTVLRRLVKRLPVSSDTERMIQSVDAMYAYDESKNPVKPEMVDVTPARPTRSEFETTPQPERQAPVTTTEATSETQAEQADAKEEQSLVYTDADGEVHSFGMLKEFSEAYTACLENINDGEVLESVWEGNLEHVNQLRTMGESGVEVADKITGTFMQCRQKFADQGNPDDLPATGTDGAGI